MESILLKQTETVHRALLICLFLLIIIEEILTSVYDSTSLIFSALFTISSIFCVKLNHFISVYFLNIISMYSFL